MSAFIKVTGQVYALGEVKTGITSGGKEWARQDIVIVTRYPRRDGAGYWEDYVCITAGTAKMDQVKNLAVGMDVTADYSVSAREWNGRWFNSLDLVNIAPVASQAAPQAEDDDCLPEFLRGE